MNRILIHIPMFRYGEYDIFNPPTAEALNYVVNQELRGNCPNWGNRLWFQGLISEISNSDNLFTFFSPDMSKDYINSNFDMIVAPMANIFSANYYALLDSLANRFEGIKIPVYVIACGIQADRYDQLDDICTAINEPASRFISSIYETGGEFALRGHFTKEFFARLGFSSAVVTGCPSMFQLGRDLTVSNEKVAEDQFLALLNGSPADYRDLFSTYPNAEFFDQNQYFEPLQNPNYFADGVKDAVHISKLIKMYGYDTASYLLHDRIRHIPDMNTWREYLIHRNFSFSYGSRIHGSIMPILAGVPALLETRDARTREMAEFFDIPNVMPNAHRNASLYELYLQTDYSKFNETFAKRYDAYEAFLQKCGIVDRIQTPNRFFHPLEEIPALSINQEKRAALAASMSRDSLYWKAFSKALSLKRKLTQRN